MSAVSMHFAKITAVFQVGLAANQAMYFGWPVLVTGKPGTGKTTALRSLSKTHGAGYFEAGQGNNSVIGLYRSVFEAFGRRPDASYKYELASECRWFLKRLAEKCDTGRPRLLAVDEYQNLSVTVIRELLALQEDTQLPLILCGNRERLATTRRDQHAYMQIKSRIGATVSIAPPAPEDIHEIAIEYAVEGRDSYDALVAYGVRMADLRLVTRLISKAAEKGSGRVRLPELQLAVMEIHGGTEAGNREAKALLLPLPAEDAA